MNTTPNNNVVGFIRTEKPTNTGWEAPESLLSGSKGATYPMTALPGIIGGAVREVVDIVKCPPALAASSALSVLSVACQGLANVQPHRKLKPSPLSLYLLSIGESGERKTTADRFFSDVLDTWASNKQAEIEPDYIRSRAQLSAWENEVAGIKDAIKQAARKQENTRELTEKLVIAEQCKPKGIHTPKMVFADATPQAIAHDLVNKWPSAGILSGEAGIVFGGHGMKADNIMSNLAFLNTAWEGGYIPVTRKGEGGSFDVRDVRLSMGLAVQPDVIRSFYDTNGEIARGSGFAARFLLAWPESTQGSRQLTMEELTSEPSKDNLNQFYHKLHEVLEQQYTNGKGGKLENLPTLQLSQGGLEVWRDYFNDVESSLLAGGQMERHKDIASKSADNAARIAGLFHLFNGGDIYDTISADMMGKAAHLAGWHLRESKRFFDEIAVPLDLSNALKLDEWLVQYCNNSHSNSINRREIQRLAPNRLRNGADLDKALDELADANRIRVISEGRKAFIEINPALLLR